jgi:hypothetical protein
MGAALKTSAKAVADTFVEKEELPPDLQGKFDEDPNK